MKTSVSKTTNARKWEIVYEDQEHTTIWKYNLDKTSKGPFEIEIKTKKKTTKLI